MPETPKGPVDSGADTVGPDALVPSAAEADTMAPAVAPSPDALASADTVAPSPAALASADTMAPVGARASGESGGGAGTRIGRYVVIGRLGAGGMGVVVSAYDPQLDRKVAIKTLLPAIAGGSQGRARLIREAQALAKLSHPNIVGIYDAGAIGEHVFIAMEFVAGKTLGAWLRDTPRTPETTLQVLLDAGRGLGAAHAVGLVHRDFKPDNVMVGDDGRVRVMDFGLARPIEAATTLETTKNELDAAPADLDDARARASRLPSLTHAGAVTGTPAYMAPEQFAGKDADERTDQFNFCVTAWEAFHGMRPFRGDSFASLAAAVIAGEIGEPGDPHRVPRWLRETLRRGLQVDPSARWPSMRDLLEALARGRGRARARRLGALLGGLGVVAVSAFGLQAIDERRRVEACEGLGASIDETWSSDARDRVVASFRGTGLTYAEDTAARVVAWIDGDVDSWRRVRTEACMRQDVDHTWTTDMRDRAEWCLENRRLALEANVEAFADADADLVSHAVATIAALHDSADCGDEHVLARNPAPPPEHRAEIRDVEARIIDANTEIQAGRYPEGVAIAAEAVERARALSWTPLEVEALEELGTAQWKSGALADAETALERAYFEAAELDDAQGEADAAQSLTALVGETLGRHDEGRRWNRLASVALGRFVTPDPTREIAQMSQAAELEFSAGDFAAAKAGFETALARAEDVYGATNPRLASLLTNLGIANANLGDLATAQALLERAAAAREEALGPDHPDLGTTLANLGSLHLAAGDLDRSLEASLRALAIWERSLGADHARVGGLLSNLADLFVARGEIPRAEEYLRRALAIEEAALGTENPEVGTTLANLAAIQVQRDDLAAAKATYARALAVREATLEADHPDLARVLLDSGELLVHTRDFDGARQRLERALAIQEGREGASGPEVGRVLDALASLALEQRRFGDAVRLGERAIAIADATEGAPPVRRASPRSTSGRAQWELGDRAAGRARVQEALSLTTAAGDLARAEDVAITEAWLREHPEY